MATKLEAVKCASPKCRKVLFERQIGWRGDPIWKICKCGKTNRISTAGQWIVRAPGDDDVLRAPGE